MRIAGNIRQRIILVVMIILLIVTGAIVTTLYYKLHTATARGAYLEKHLERYYRYQRFGEETLLHMAFTTASVPGLPSALSKASREEVEALKPSLLKVLQSSITPDVAVLYDSNMTPHTLLGDKGYIPKSPLWLGPVLAGGSMSGPALFGDPPALLVAAVPVTDGTNRTGALVVGRWLSHYFDAYSVDSDGEALKRHQLAFTLNGEVVASTAPAEEWKDVYKAISGQYTEKEGSVDVPVLSLKGRSYDLFDRAVPAVSDGKESKNGTITIYRVRQSFTTRLYDALLPVLIVAFAGAIVAFFLARYLAGTITRPIVHFTNSVSELASGDADLSKRFATEGGDEISRLAASLNQLFEKLSSLVLRIRDGSQSLGDSSNEITSVALKTQEGADGQVRMIESSMSVINELARTIQQINDQSTHGVEISGLGKDSLTKTNAALQRIQDTVHVTASEVVNLKGSVEKIGAIAELISKITEENTMLALNAAIEAARAGAAGQGFAVVAQQMREQARRVEKSSREIIDNISAIQSITRGLVQSMDNTKSATSQGSESITITLHLFEELSAVMQETAESVREQVTANDNMAQTMLEFRHIAGSALENSKQTVGEAQNIRGSAMQLSRLVGNFKLHELGSDSDQIDEAHHKAIKAPDQ